MRLGTFVQISDLHFGLVDPASFDARTEVWRRLPWLDGMLGHSYRSLERLVKFFDQIREDEPGCQLIVTGDLTTVGHPDEFDTAGEYLADQLRPPKGRYLGLEVANWRDWAIPGNHDHWPGSPRILGTTTSAFVQYFPNLPQADPCIPLSTGHEVRFLRIDTDANVGKLSQERILARGSFCGELDKLSENLRSKGLETPGVKEIRVLCLHHSRSYRGFFLRIDEPSRRRLDRFIQEHGVSILLCGHIHEPPTAKPLQAESPKGLSLNVLEGRSGTTSQLDKSFRRCLSLGWLGRKWQNSLLLHRLMKVGDEIHWQTEVYLESRKTFERADALRSDVQAVTTILAWPTPGKSP